MFKNLPCKQLRHIAAANGKGIKTIDAVRVIKRVSVSEVPSDVPAIPARRRRSPDQMVRVETKEQAIERLFKD